jgi:hypothetical protein
MSYDKNVIFYFFKKKRMVDTAMLEMWDVYM